MGLSVGRLCALRAHIEVAFGTENLHTMTADLLIIGAEEKVHSCPARASFAP